MSRVIVRPATVADARGIAEVHVETSRVAYDGIVPAERLARQSVEHREQLWRTSIDAPEDPTVGVDVAVLDGEVVGFCATSRSRDDDAAAEVGEVQALYVVPRHWGTGAGSALLLQGEQRLRDLGFTCATLWVLADNAPTRNWYERRGWQPDGQDRVGERGSAPLSQMRYRKRLEERAPITQEGSAT